MSSTNGEPLLLPIPSFGPFRNWARTERADQWAGGWDDEGPLLTIESAEVERRLLDEYLALPDVVSTTTEP